MSERPGARPRRSSKPTHQTFRKLDQDPPQAFQGGTRWGPDVSAFVFKALSGFSAAYRHRPKATPLSMAFDGVRRTPIPPDLLVGSSDTDIAVYDERLRALGITSWVATLYNCQRYDWRIFLTAKHILKAHTAGMLASSEPDVRADVDMWIGNYPETPSGVHKDVASNYSLVLLGRKAYDFWPDAVFSPTGLGQYGHETVDPATVAEASQPPLTICGSPGDLIFWPRSYWHVAHPSRGPTATMNVGLYRIGEDEEEAQHAISWAISQTRSVKSAASAVGPASPLFEVLRNLSKDPASFGRALACERDASLLTAGGLQRLPDPDFAYFGLKTGTRVYEFDSRSDFELRRGPDQLALVVNGHVFPLPPESASQCEALVEELRNMTSVTIDHENGLMLPDCHVDVTLAGLRFAVFGLLVAAMAYVPRSP